MKVFISWSGDRSHMVARGLYDWLPDVLHRVEPFLSSLDIPRGDRWALDLARRLDQYEIGILCLTPENLNSPWILFEAGALSKRLESSLVCPYLFEVDLEVLAPPLNQFNAAKATKDDTFRLLQTINASLRDEALPSQRLENAFERWWPDLEERLRAIPKRTVSEESHGFHQRDRQLLKDVLMLVESADRRLEAIEQLLGLR